MGTAVAMSWIRRLIAVAVMSILTLHGVGAAHAEPVSDYGAYGDLTPGYNLPGFDATQNSDATPVPYEYDSLDPALATKSAPAPDEIAELGPWQVAVKNNPANSIDGMIARWQKYLSGKADTGATAKPWDAWRDAYVQVLTNRRVGPAFERFMREDFWKLPADQWTSDSALPGADDGPRYDVFNVADGVPKDKWLMIELKSGTELSQHAKNQFKDHLTRMGQAGSGMLLMFAGKPSEPSLRWIKRTVDEFSKKITMPRAFAVRYIPAVPVAKGSTGGTPLPGPLDASAATPEMQALMEELNALLDEETASGPTAAPVEKRMCDRFCPTARPEAPAPQAPAPVANPAPVAQPAPVAPAPVAKPAPAPVAPAPVAPAPAPVAPAPAPAPIVVAPPPVVVAPPPVVVAPAPVAPAPVAPAPAPVAPAPVAPAPAPVAPAPVAPAPVAPAPAPAPVAPAPVAAPLGPPATGYEPPLGGIDFTSLEMRYASDTVNGKPAIQYAFRANAITGEQASYGGKRNATMALDAFHVWLALEPDKFWVNLNPTEPDRIIDSAFGRTEAGQILLEADLEMKRESARLQDSDTDLGKRFADALRGDRKCVDGRRHWIEPLPATVHEDGDQLYIIDAPLTVKLGTEDSDISPGKTCADEGQDAATTKANLELYQQMILPALDEVINHGPAFADLRRVYSSRVVAEWYRKRNAAKPGQFAKLINSGNIDKWVTDWSPRGVFDDYVKSFNLNPPEGTRKWTTPDGTIWTASIGGVVFDKVELKEMGTEEFAKTQEPEMKFAAPSITGPLTAPSGNQVWIGNIVSSVPLTELWPPRSEPWTPYSLAVPAPTKPMFFVLVALPAVVWLASGGFLVWRKRRRTIGIR